MTISRDSASVVISHVHGNANVRQACLALAEAGLLHSFWTALAWNPQSFANRFLPGSLRRQLERRTLPEAVRRRAMIRPWREIARLSLGRAGAIRLPDFLSPDACAEALDRTVARFLASARGSNVGAVYAYDHGAVESFRVAERAGMVRLYELPIGYWRAHDAIIAGEAARWPAWKDPVLEVDFRLPKFLRKDEEIGRASRIIVPSRFVERSLQQHFTSLPPVHVIPYGAPDADPIGEGELDRSDRGPLRVLYVGALGLRKGAPYLFSALDHFGCRIERTIVGRLTTRNATLSAGLSRCTWFESLPRQEILALMRKSDVFVFPTLFEGMALVVLEAMAQGCAVITTPHSGAEDLIRHGENGFLVPVRSPESIIEVMERLDADRAALRRVRLAANRSMVAHSWSVYRGALMDAVRSRISAPGDPNTGNATLAF